jgi:hypothetical protein
MPKMQVLLLAWEMSKEQSKRGDGVPFRVSDGAGSCSICLNLSPAFPPKLPFAI